MGYPAQLHTKNTAHSAQEESHTIMTAWGALEADVCFRHDPQSVQGQSFSVFLVDECCVPNERADLLCLNALCCPPSLDSWLTSYPGALFLVLYIITAVYFSGVMVRLMLVLAPAVCCLAGVAIADILSTSTASIMHAVAAAGGTPPVNEPAAAAGQDTEEDPGKPTTSKTATGRKREKAASGSLLKGAFVTGGPGYAVPWYLAVGAVVLLVGLLVTYVQHCVYVSADMYSAPSIVLQSHRPDGSFYVFDDFREAYAWTTAMANRTVIVDNNTWNNTHIATVGRAMASPELKGWRIFRSLDVDYVFVVFGGLHWLPLGRHQQVFVDGPDWRGRVPRHQGAKLPGRRRWVLSWRWRWRWCWCWQC